MKKRIQTFPVRVPNTAFPPGLKGFAVVILLLFFGPLYSQEGVGTTPVISLHEDAKIYSADPNLNRQLISQGNVDYKLNAGKKGVVFNAKNTSFRKKVKKLQSKIYVRNKDQESLQKIKQQVSNFEKRKKSFDLYGIHSFPSPHEFLSSSYFNRDYTVPTRDSNDFSKIIFQDYNNLARIPLDYLYPREYHYYNNNPLDFCYSSVYSVRPPPVALL
ncbi:MULTISPECIES: hypothetical protein [Chryseobacterium]|uniref:Uncharacterized protein n=1 Tax=Chryseobacterium camelliae TaxID=1265445 RepID=A0ABU0TKY2_9FLAO|nr:MULTISPECIES: hypothetical protein [Chryseobacterium]MDT3408448.1 hypothetical protein [Pseudacidovorax intermedius]MDQ1097697.1 hypothetical protein [Chryseobacterium camelliae]MDQ1101628.1 hypothetical protein [Chryseobacterium sp. SORGH_AS_1048]MDR6085069.1 hypothetical protein [Chryseobacterium sp. SORGH_AS_0909]MDR6129424.1 hypothetical protein [Chryseobacterium sp. SORGH_AS_1175]